MPAAAEGTRVVTHRATAGGQATKCARLHLCASSFPLPTPTLCTALWRLQGRAQGGRHPLPAGAACLEAGGGRQAWLWRPEQGEPAAVPQACSCATRLRLRVQHEVVALCLQLCPQGGSAREKMPWRCSGCLQVVLEFPSVFWNDSVDYFGAAGEPTGKHTACCGHACKPQMSTCSTRRGPARPCPAPPSLLRRPIETPLPATCRCCSPHIVCMQVWHPASAPRFARCLCTHTLCFLPSFSAEDARGRCFMWWNFHRFSGAPTLAALVSGEQAVGGGGGGGVPLHAGEPGRQRRRPGGCRLHFVPQVAKPVSSICCPGLIRAGASARSAEEQPAEELRDAALAVLRRVHPGVDVPEPVAWTVSKWASGGAGRQGAAQQGRGVHHLGQAASVGKQPWPSCTVLPACPATHLQRPSPRRAPFGLLLQSPTRAAATRTSQWVPQGSTTTPWPRYKRPAGLHPHAHVRADGLHVYLTRFLRIRMHGSARCAENALSSRPQCVHCSLPTPELCSRWAAACFSPGSTLRESTPTQWEEPCCQVTTNNHFSTFKCAHSQLVLPPFLTTACCAARHSAPAAALHRLPPGAVLLAAARGARGEHSKTAGRSAHLPPGCPPAQACARRRVCWMLQRRRRRRRRRRHLGWSWPKRIGWVVARAGHLGTWHGAGGRGGARRRSADAVPHAGCKASVALGCRQGSAPPDRPPLPRPCAQLPSALGKKRKSSVAQEAAAARAEEDEDDWGDAKPRQGKRTGTGWLGTDTQSTAGGDDFGGSRGRTGRRRIAVAARRASLAWHWWQCWHSGAALLAQPVPWAVLSPPPASPPSPAVLQRASSSSGSAQASSSRRAAKAARAAAPAQAPSGPTCTRAKSDRQVVPASLSALLLLCCTSTLCGCTRARLSGSQEAHARQTPRRGQSLYIHLYIHQTRGQPTCGGAL